MSEKLAAVDLNKQAGMKLIKFVAGDQAVGNAAGFKYCSPGGLQGKWKQRSLL